MFEYDVAISFAGEQRPEAEAIAACLRSTGVKVFYDRYEQANLWGKDLYEHLSDIYNKKARYCLMLVSVAYAGKVWTTHERKNAQARALSQRSEYILPVRFDETEIPGLPSTVGYLEFEDHGAQGICTLLLQKLGSTPGPSEGQIVTALAVVPEPKEFWEQRRRLAETDILRKVWSKPRWRIGIRPTEFKRARFRDVEQCRQFMMSSCVRGWFPYPWIHEDSLKSGDGWIAGEIDASEDPRIRHLEHWVLFRSAQFVYNRAFDDIPQLAGRIHVLGILDIATATFEFAARMAERDVFSPEAVVTFGFSGLDGRTLAWPKDVIGDLDEVGQDCWCQDESFSLASQVAPGELRVRRRKLALEVALEIYRKFGWSDPPIDRLSDEQKRRFGAV